MFFTNKKPIDLPANKPHPNPEQTEIINKIRENAVEIERLMNLLRVEIALSKQKDAKLKHLIRMKNLYDEIEQQAVENPLFRTHLRLL